MFTQLQRARRLRWPLVLIFLLWSAGYSKAQLSGTYTIDPSSSASSTNYQDFASAVGDMVSGTRADGGTANGSGVSGKVTFRVADGTYNEQISISQISGASATNTITFVSDKGDSSKVILQHASSSSSSSNYTLALNGVDHVTFQQITITRTGTSTYGRVIAISGNAHYNTFDRCQIIGVQNSSSSTNIIVIWTDTDQDSVNTFVQNRVRFGSKGFYINGSSSNHKYGWVIRNNMVDSTYDNGIEVRYTQEPVVEGNIVSNMRNSGDGIYAYSWISGTLTRNIVRSQNMGYGILLSLGEGTTANPGVASNNIIENNGSAGTAGIYIYNLNEFYVVHNTFVINSTSTTVRAVYVNGSATFSGKAWIWNNVMVNNGGNYALEVSSNAIVSGYAQLDYNLLYTTGTVLVQYGTDNLANLAAWRSKSGMGLHSVSGKPYLSSDLHGSSQSFMMESKGTPVTVATTDIDGDTRSTTAPDLGADEFSLSGKDLVVNRILPANDFCPGKKDVVLDIYNASTSQVDSFRVSVEVDGTLQSNNVFVFSFAANDDTTITVGSVTYGSKAKNMKVYISKVDNQSTDANTANDTATKVVQSAMGGTYTIGGTSADYANLQDAVADLNQVGLCSAAVFEISDGIYHGKFRLGNIKGASASNTVTFISKSNDSTKVFIIDSSQSSSTDNYLVMLDGADYVTFKHLTFSRPYISGNGYAQVFDISNGAHYITITNNRIWGSVTTSTSDNYGIINSGSTTDSFTVITYNEFKYGSTVIELGGASSGREAGTLIAYNLFDSMYYHQVYLTYQSDAKITHNRHNSYSNASTSNYGIYLANSIGGTITNNQIYQDRGNYSIYLNSSDGSASARGLVANNMSSLGNTGGTAGIRLTNSTYYDVVYNTAVVTSSSTSARAFYGTASTSAATGYNRVFNNIFMNTGKGFAIEVDKNAVTTNLLDTIDHNLYYSAGAEIADWNGTDYTTFSAWQTASGMDPNSVSGDPGITSATDLHIIGGAKSLLIDGIGTPLTIVNTDIDGDARDASNPDLGADEFTPIKNDLLAVSIISPENGACGDSSAVVAVEIRNGGVSSQSSFNVKADISGAASQSLSYSYSGTLTAGQIDTIFFSTTLNTYQGGTFLIKAYTDLSGDQQRSNDTIMVSITLGGIPAAPKVTGDSRCGAGELDLVAGTSTVGGKIFWFDSPLGKDIVASGDTLHTGVLNATDTFYAAVAVSKSSSIGPVDNTVLSTSGGFYDYKYAMVFDAYKDIILDSVAVFADGAGTAEISLEDGNGSVVASKTVTVKGTQTKEWVKLGFNIKQGSGYKLFLIQGSNTTTKLYRHDAGASYPYSNDDISITGNTFSSGPKYWYYWFDWRYTTAGCFSPRAAVVAEVKKAPAGAYIQKGKVFDGYFNQGTSSNPDKICAGNMAIYELVPPSGFSNSGFGTAWTITALTFETSGGTGAKDTVLSLPGINNGTLTFTPVASAAGNTYILTVSIADMKNGCDTTFSRYVEVIPRPKADFTATDVCLGENTEITFTGNIGSGMGSYLYYFGDGDSATFASPTHVYAAPGKYEIKLIATNASGCIDSIKKTVTVYDLPEARFSAINACINTPVAFIDSSVAPAGVNIVSRKWYFGDGSTSNAQNPTHTYAGSGKFLVSLVVYSDQGCSDSIAKQVTVYTTPNVDFTFGGSCENAGVQFDNKFSSASFTYAWDFGDGSTSTDENPMHTFAAGTYDVKLIVTNANGCRDSATHQVVVNAAPVAAFTAADVCMPQSVSLADASTISSGAINKWEWDFGDGTTSQLQNPTVTYANAGAYKIMLKVTSDNGCSDTLSQIVNVFPAASPLTEVSDACEGDATVFTDKSTISGGTIVSWKWMFGDGDSSLLQNPQHTYAAAGTYNVVLHVTTDKGCTYSVNTAAEVYTLPSVTVSHTVDKRKATFSVSDATLASYSWYFGDGDSSHDVNPVHEYSENGTYIVTLRVQNSNGCETEVTDSVTIDVSGIAPVESNNYSLDVYPNPFTDNFNVKYHLEKGSNVRVALFDINGREVAVIASGQQPAGDFSYSLNTVNYNMPAGVYLLRMTVDGNMAVKQLIRLK